MKYEYLEHTADAKFKAYGRTLKDAFENAGYALFGIMTDQEKVKPNTKKQIDITAKRQESLLYDFLEELLFLFETEHFIPGTITIDRLDKEIIDSKEIIPLDQEQSSTHASKNIFRLCATLNGDDIKKYEINGDIKSITYNDMDIKQTDQGFELTVVVDI